eukprot:7813811-Alexandrium_andersonii.AAC.1
MCIRDSPRSRVLSSACGFARRVLAVALLGMVVARCLGLGAAQPKQCAIEAKTWMGHRAAVILQTSR